MTEKDRIKILNEMLSPDEQETEQTEKNPTTKEDEANLKERLESLELARSKFMEGKSKHVYRAGKFSRWV